MSSSSILSNLIGVSSPLMWYENVSVSCQCLIDTLTVAFADTCPVLFGSRSFRALGLHGCKYTRYSSCCNADKGIYYYTTYNNLEITSVDMHAVDLEQTCLYTYEVKGLE